MLRVQVELIPGGIDALKRTLAEVYVANDGQDRKKNVLGHVDIGNYDVYSSDPREHAIVRDDEKSVPQQRQQRPCWIGRIENFERARGHEELASYALDIARLDPGAYAVDIWGVKRRRVR